MGRRARVVERVITAGNAGESRCDPSDEPTKAHGVIEAGW